MGPSWPETQSENRNHGAIVTAHGPVTPPAKCGPSWSGIRFPAAAVSQTPGMPSPGYAPPEEPLAVWTCVMVARTRATISRPGLRLPPQKRLPCGSAARCLPDPEGVEGRVPDA